MNWNIDCPYCKKNLGGVAAFEFELHVKGCKEHERFREQMAHNLAKELMDPLGIDHIKDKCKSSKAVCDEALGCVEAREPEELKGPIGFSRKIERCTEPQSVPCDVGCGCAECDAKHLEFLKARERIGFVDSEEPRRKIDFKLRGFTEVTKLDEEQSKRAELFAKYYLQLSHLSTGDKELDRQVDVHHWLEDCRIKIIRHLVEKDMRNV